MIEEYFGFKYREGDIDVSLSSFSENELPDELVPVLGNSQLVQITLTRSNGEARIGLTNILEISKRIREFIEEHPDDIFYYYCDEIHPIPHTSPNKSKLPPAQYRNRLFSSLTQRSMSQVSHGKYVDRPIIITTDLSNSFIHLIYDQSLQEKATGIDNYLKGLAQDEK